MTQSFLFKPTFLLSLLMQIIGLILKFTHHRSAHILIVLSFILTITWIISALYEIYSSNRVTIKEKILLTIAFIMLSTITGLLYFFIGRPRLIQSHNVINQSPNKTASA